jgi:hypothetical protein
MSPIESCRTTSNFNPGGRFAVGPVGDTRSQIIFSQNGRWSVHAGRLVREGAVKGRPDMWVAKSVVAVGLARDAPTSKETK